VLAWLALVVVSFFIPNGFFMFWGNYVSLIGSSIFILIGLVLLVDFAHTWSETCLDNWETTDSNVWKWILIGSTLTMYAAALALSIVDYVFFAKSGCGLNQFFITTNLVLGLIASALSVAPAVQEANPKSGLCQTSMVVLYTTYLVTSAVANHKSEDCNPLSKRSTPVTNTMIVLGALFTFLAIAYSTSRAATQSKALVGKAKGGGSRDDGYSQLSTEADELGVVTDQPKPKDSLRVQAIVAAIQAG
jgi:hypothetical protein